MGRFLRLYGFHLKVYMKNSYFFWLPITSTLTFICLQYIALYASGSASDPDLWLRSGVFGLWTSATTATGSIGYQRHLGTLPYLINTQVGDAYSLLSLLLPAASFGLLSFPLAYLLALVFNTGIQAFTLSILVQVLMLFLGAVVMDLFIAGFFVLTPNAIIYEELLHLPVMLLSGLLGTFALASHWISWTQWLIPIIYPIQALLGRGDHLSIVAYGFSLVLWLVLAVTLGSYLLRSARKQGLGRRF